MPSDWRLKKLASEDYEAERYWTRLIWKYDDAWIPRSKYAKPFAEAGQSLELADLNAQTDSYFNEKSEQELWGTGILAITYLNKYIKFAEANVRCLKSGSMDALRYPYLIYPYRLLKWSFLPIVLYFFSLPLFAAAVAIVLLPIFYASRRLFIQDQTRRFREIRVLKLARQEIRDGSIDIKTTISYLVGLSPAFIANGRPLRLLRQLEKELHNQRENIDANIHE